MATNVQAKVRETLAAPASSLIRVPEIENDSTADAIRKLQVQIFHLADELTRAHNLIDELQRERRR
jgi:hypothetical protein